VNDETLTAQMPAMSDNPIEEGAVDALYEELFRIGKHQNDPVPMDPKAIIRKHLTAAQQQGQAVAVELVRDAERYQWMRECAWSHPEAAPACAIFGVDGSMLRSIDGADLDAAIDQARGTASEAKS
jgi:hypothetical protein